MSKTRLLFGACAVAALICVSPARAQSADASEAEDQWVAGNLTFMAYHELGHLLLDQTMRVNQSAQRLASEQAADDIATWLLSPDPGQPVDSAEVIAAIEGWLESADERAAGGPWDNPHYPDDETRASRIACLLIGSDKATPNAFADLEPIAALRFDLAQCAGDFDAIDRKMEQTFGEGEAVKANPQARVSVQFDAAPPALAEARDFLIRSRVLDDLRQDIVDYIGLPVTVVLRGAACGEDSPGFKYSPSQREITACYEEVDWFLFGDSLAGTAAGQRQGAGDALGARPRRITPRPVQMQSPPPPPPRTPR